MPPHLLDAQPQLEETIRLHDVRAAAFTHKREQGWGRRTMLVAAASDQGVTHRMAWEVDGHEVTVWAYGPHEGFSQRLARRARQ
jgi:hypothetical protein